MSSPAQAAEKVRALHSDNFDEQANDYYLGELEKYKLDVAEYDAALYLQLSNFTNDDFIANNSLFEQELLTLRDQITNNDGHNQTNPRRASVVQDAIAESGEDKSRDRRDNGRGGDHTTTSVSQSPERETNNALFEPELLTLRDQNTNNDGSQSQERQVERNYLSSKQSLHYEIERLSAISPILVVSKPLDLVNIYRDQLSSQEISDFVEFTNFDNNLAVYIPNIDQVVLFADRIGNINQLRQAWLHETIHSANSKLYTEAEFVQFFDDHGIDFFNGLVSSMDIVAYHEALKVDHRGAINEIKACIVDEAIAYYSRKFTGKATFEALLGNVLDTNKIVSELGKLAYHSFNNRNNKKNGIRLQQIILQDLLSGSLLTSSNSGRTEDLRHVAQQKSDDVGRKTGVERGYGTSIRETDEVGTSDVRFVSSPGERSIEKQTYVSEWIPRTGNASEGKVDGNDNRTTRQAEQIADPIVQATTTEEKHLAVSAYVKQLNELSGADAVVFSKLEQLPDVVALEFEAQWRAEPEQETPGVTIETKVYIYAPHIKDIADLETVFNHEVAAHRNVLLALGQDPRAEAVLYSAVVDDIGVPKMLQFIEDPVFLELADLYFETPTQSRKIELGKEFVGYFTENHFDKKEYSSVGVGKLSLNLSEKITVEEVVNILNTANRKGNEQRITIENSKNGIGRVAYEEDNTRNMGQNRARQDSDLARGGSNIVLAPENTASNLSGIQKNPTYSKNTSGGSTESDSNSGTEVRQEDIRGVSGAEQTGGARDARLTSRSSERKVKEQASLAKEILQKDTVFGQKVDGINKKIVYLGHVNSSEPNNQNYFRNGIFRTTYSPYGGDRWERDTNESIEILSARDADNSTADGSDREGGNSKTNLHPVSIYTLKGSRTNYTIRRDRRWNRRSVSPNRGGGDNGFYTSEENIKYYRADKIMEPIDQNTFDQLISIIKNSTNGLVEIITNPSEFNLIVARIANKTHLTESQLLKVFHGSGYDFDQFDTKHIADQSEKVVGG